MEPVPWLLYHDHRLFVLDINLAEVSRNQDGLLSTCISEKMGVKESTKWTLTTRRNHTRLPPYRSDHFETLGQLVEYVRRVEPETPRRDLSGKSPKPAPPYDEYLGWLKDQGLCGCLEQKLRFGGYFKPRAWARKNALEARMLAECLGVLSLRQVIASESA